MTKIKREGATQTYQSTTTPNVISEKPRNPRGMRDIFNEWSPFAPSKPEIMAQTTNINNEKINSSTI